MDQSHNFVLELKDEMTWSRGDNQRRTLAYFDNDVGRQRNKSVMTQEKTILSQKGDQYLGELLVAELAIEDKEKLSNLREYDEELKMLEDWLVNTRIDKDDCLMYASIEMFSENIGEDKLGIQGIKLSYNDMILLQQSREMEDQHNFVEHLGIPYSWGMIVDERINPEDMRMPQVAASSKMTKDKQDK